MEIIDIELKEKFVKGDILMVVIEKELLVVIKVFYIENIFKNWCKIVCDVWYFYEVVKEYVFLINKIVKLYRL